MLSSGMHLTILVGPKVPVPLPMDMMQAVESIEVTHSDEGRSGFQMVLRAERQGTSGTSLDYPMLERGIFRPFNRMVLTVMFGGVPSVLMDGIITHHQLSPGGSKDKGIVTITGEDVSVMMDLQERSVEHPCQDDSTIALKIIMSYSEYGLVPTVIPPPTTDQPMAADRVPVQQGTDLEFLSDLAERHAYSFHITPGPVPLTNTAYWGPPQTAGTPQRALSVDMGPDTNVESIDFEGDLMAPTIVEGSIKDKDTNRTVPIRTLTSTRLPLTGRPAIQANMPKTATS